VDDETQARHDDEAWQRFIGRRRDSTRRRRRRDLGFAWALLLGTLAVGVLVGLLIGLLIALPVGRIGGNCVCLKSLDGGRMKPTRPSGRGEDACLAAVPTPTHG
jgi:hypothetical protein